jgi:hypothetical protein
MIGVQRAGTIACSARRNSRCAEGAVVAGEWKHALVERDGATADRDRCLEQCEFATGFKVGPVDDDHRPLDPAQHGSSDCGVDARALDVQPDIPEQAVDRFDVVLFEGVAAPGTAQLRQRQLRPAQRGRDDANERSTARLVLDESSLFEPA